MGEFVCFALGVFELAVAFTIICLGAYCIACTREVLWCTFCDKMQFFKWLKEEGDKNVTDSDD